MLVTLRDLQKYHLELKTYYLSMYVKPTGSCKVINGFLYSLYDTESIRTAMKEKRNVALTAPRLCAKHRIKSLTNIGLLLEAVDKYEKEYNEKQTKNR